MAHGGWRLSQYLHKSTILDCTPGNWTKDEMDFSQVSPHPESALARIGLPMEIHWEAMRMNHTFHLQHVKDVKSQGRDGNIKLSFYIWGNSGKGKWADWGHMTARNKIVKRTQGCPNSGLNFVFCYSWFIYWLFPVPSGIGVNCKFQRVGSDEQVNPCQSFFLLSDIILVENQSIHLLKTACHIKATSSWTHSHWKAHLLEAN